MAQLNSAGLPPPLPQRQVLCSPPRARGCDSWMGHWALAVALGRGGLGRAHLFLGAVTLRTEVEPGVGPKREVPSRLSHRRAGEGGGGGSPASSQAGALGRLAPPGPHRPLSPIAAAEPPPRPREPARVERAAGPTGSSPTGAGPAAAREAGQHAAAEAVAASLIEDQPGWLGTFTGFADRPYRAAARVSSLLMLVDGTHASVV